MRILKAQSGRRNEQPTRERGYISSGCSLCDFPFGGSSLRSILSSGSEMGIVFVRHAGRLIRQEEVHKQQSLRIASRLHATHLVNQHA